MRRTLVLVTLLVLGACGENAQEILDPVVANSQAPPAANAVVTVDGSQYTIGCPNYPCPVAPIVVDLIAKKSYMWMPAGMYRYPAIYVYGVNTVVKLMPVPDPSILPPPIEPPSPYLDGPTKFTGMPLAGTSQVSCSDIGLTLTIPDNGTWDFVSGELDYDYVRWSAAANDWVSAGPMSIVPFSYVVWGRMLAGTFRTIPPVGGLDYYVTVAVTLKRGTFTKFVSHKLLCARQAAPVVPPTPSLSGPGQYLGTRPTPAIGNLVCSNIGASLISPDNGSWAFMSGERLIEFLRFDTPSGTWVKNGTSRTDALSATDWQDLLAGTYQVNLNTRSGPYSMTFSAMVQRGQYVHTISYQADCGGPDFFAAAN